MRYELSLSIVILLTLESSLFCAARPWDTLLDSPHRWLSSLSSTKRSKEPHERRSNDFETNNDGSTFIWLLQDDYSGDSFYDKWGFFDGDDPTHGSVNYVNRDEAFGKGLVYTGSDGEVIMKSDNTTWLPEGTFRDSVRISSFAQYNTGLFILDLNHAPWGCGIWPAFWTIGSGNWPDAGEIDIIEGVHDNEHNQVAWHTSPGCYLNPNASFSGSVVLHDGVNNTNCDARVNSNSGCGVTQWSRASYGPYFDQQGGGVFAMKWDENGIAVYNFYRAAIPADVNEGVPTPSKWGRPDAFLDPEWCDPIRYFVNHSMIFDITFCGDWAGNSYATTNCPGTCAERLMDPANFANASWSINSLKVYRKQALNGVVDGALALECPSGLIITTLFGLMTITVLSAWSVL